MENNKNWRPEFDKPLVIAGPCSAESEQQVLSIAEKLDPTYTQVFRAGIWKPRTKPGMFEGVGAVGLKWLQKVKEEFKIPVATEVANAAHVKEALDHDIDYLWIGARSTVNPFTVQEIAESLRDTDKIVFVKNPVNPDLELWMGAIERLQAQGIKKLGAIHRGFSTYKKTKYRNNPQWQIALDFRTKMPHIPMICDPSHIAGRRDLIFDISQQAFNYEYDGLMVETHIDPDNAWSDAAQQVTPDVLLAILKKIELRKHDDVDTKYHSELNQLRQSIDELDKEIWDNYSDRMKVAGKIGQLKKAHNVATYQSERWNEIFENTKSNVSKLGLSEEFIEKVLQAIHQESLDIQNKILND